MKKIFILLFFFNFSHSQALNFKLERIVENLEKPWSLSFIDKENIIFTEKSGKIYLLNLQEKKTSIINSISPFRHKKYILMIHVQIGWLS